MVLLFLSFWGTGDTQFLYSEASGVQEVHCTLILGNKKVHSTPILKLHGNKRYTVLLFWSLWGTRGLLYSRSEASVGQEVHGTPILKLLVDERYTVLLF